MKVDINAPWWEAAASPHLSDHWGINWATTGLMCIKLCGGPEVLEGETSDALKDKDTFKKFVRRFEKKFPELNKLSFDDGSYSQGDRNRYFYNPRSLVMFASDGDAKATVTYATNDPELIAKLTKWWKRNTTIEVPPGRVHVLISTREGLEFKSMGVAGESLIRENYSQKVLKGYDRMVADLTSPHPNGRVAILDGRPGTGKTYLIRGLLNDVKDVIFVIVPSNLVAQLAQPGTIPSLIKLHKDRHEKPMCFIIEDADEVLAPRAADNMSGVSSILNLGDGILGKLLDIHIVATTNQLRTELDEAIMRPGRLSVSIEVGPLSSDEARAVYKRLTKVENLTGDEGICGNMTLAEVYQKARDKGWVAVKQKKAQVGFSSNRVPMPFDD